VWQKENLWNILLQNMICVWIFFAISLTNIQCHAMKGISLRRSDSRICTETDEWAIWSTRAECRSEAIVRSRKLLDIRYHAHSSSENIFRPAGKIQALSLTHAWEETERNNAFLENQHRCNCTSDENAPGSRTKSGRDYIFYMSFEFSS